MTYVDEAGDTRTIDFLRSVAGLDEVRGIETAILDERGDAVASLQVLNPVACLRSRAHNVARLPGYQNRHALAQLDVAIHCVYAFAAELLAAGYAKIASDANDAVIDLAGWNIGLEVYVDHGVDVLRAVCLLPGLAEKFYSHRWPRVERWVRGKRERLAALRRRRGATTE